MPSTLIEVPATSRGGEETSAPEYRMEERVGSVALALLPGILVVYLSFKAGGFFAGSVGMAALVVAQVLLVRVLFARRPFAGSSRLHVAAVGAFAAYSAWTLASIQWSHATGRGFVEFDRALLYLLLLFLFGSIPRSSWRIPLMVHGLAAAALIVCTVGLITRVLPHLWPVAAGVAANRLSYPLTYANALGLLATIGILLLVGIAGNPRERLWVQALASAGVPVIACTLLFTFSRGPIGALIIGAAVLLLTGFSASMGAALFAVVPATALAVITAYQADVLASPTPTIPAGIAQGRHVALIVIVSALGAAALRAAIQPIERRFGRRAPSLPQRTRWSIAVGAVALGLLVAVLAGAPGFISREYDRFLKPPKSLSGDVRSRLTDLSNDGRLPLWKAASKAFQSEPLTGTGAGTFEWYWYRYRSRAFQSYNVVNTHNLYLQTLSDLGIVGVVLLGSTLIVILIGLGRRIRGPNRVAYAALFAAAVAWVIHAGFDWDWEMPAVTAWLFAVAGAALSRRARRRPPPFMVSGLRVPVAALLLVLAVTPVLLMLSEGHLASAADSFENGDCAAARRAAISSINVFAVRPQPYQIVGYCDIADGRARDAVAAFEKAVEQETKNWEYHYGLAIADAYAEIDPRAQLDVSMHLNPGDPLILQMAPALATTSRTQWRAIARHAYAETLQSGRLTLR